jgi:hypothetical protein
MFNNDPRNVYRQAWERRVKLYEIDYIEDNNETNNCRFLLNTSHIGCKHDICLWAYPAVSCNGRLNSSMLLKKRMLTSFLFS